jgi:hypothetical protein
MGTRAVTPEDRSEARTALELLDRIAERAGDASDSREYSSIFGARALLRDALLRRMRDREREDERDHTV